MEWKPTIPKNASFWTNIEIFKEEDSVSKTSYNEYLRELWVEIVRVGVVRGGNCPGENCPGGNCPVGIVQV